MLYSLLRTHSTRRSSKLKQVISNGRWNVLSVWQFCGTRYKLFHDGGPYHIETAPLICADLLCKSMDWFLYDRDLRHDGVSELNLSIRVIHCSQFYNKTHQFFAFVFRCKRMPDVDMSEWRHHVYFAWNLHYLWKQ